VLPTSWFSTPKDATGTSFRSRFLGDSHEPPDHGRYPARSNQAYADEYARVNKRINEVAGCCRPRSDAELSSQPLAAAERTDTVNIKGDFPHKTAATRAGLGWIVVIANSLRGIWVMVRLGTVFTDLELPCGPPWSATSAVAVPFASKPARQMH